MTSFENNGVCWIMWKNTVDPDRRQMAICRTHIACYVPLTRNTHLEYVIHIPLPLQHCYKNAPPCYVIRTLRALLEH
jgi:hypothetical protein